MAHWRTRNPPPRHQSSAAHTSGASDGAGARPPRIPPPPGAWVQNPKSRSIPARSTAHTLACDHQQSIDFTGLKSLAALELAVNPACGPPQLCRVQALTDIAKGVMTDRILMPHPALPLRQLGLLLELEKTGDLNHLAQDQAQ